jgi:hypothetical protein
LKTYQYSMQVPAKVIWVATVYLKWTRLARVSALLSYADLPEQAPGQAVLEPVRTTVFDTNTNMNTNSIDGNETRTNCVRHLHVQ